MRKLKNALEDVSAKVAHSLENEHKILRNFKHFYESLKVMRRGTIRNLLETDGNNWEDSTC